MADAKGNKRQDERMLYEVEDIDVSSDLSSVYDIVVFASGYEERASYAARQLEHLKYKNSIILGFSELSSQGKREENDKYFSEHWTKQIINISADNEEPLTEQLSGVLGNVDINPRVLIDYSSMSRLWYSEILNWARLAPGLDEVTIDFLYSVGDHHIESDSTMVVNDILCIPGCEGLSGRKGNSIAIFGLGLNGLASDCIAELLEPDKILCYFASPGAYPEYSSIAKEQNSQFLDERSVKITLELPLSSVEMTYRYLAELILPYRGKADIIFVPMGPKPHVLAAILVALRFEDIACIRVSSKRHRPEPVNAKGSLFATRVRFRS